MDKSWMTIKNRIRSKVYPEGVQYFVEFAKSNVGLGEDIWCPCIDCMNDKKQSIEVVKIHLILKGISPTYKTWVQTGGVGDNGFICDDDDELAEEPSDEEEEFPNDFDSEVDSDSDIDPDIEP